MRIAVLLYGHLRNFKECAPTLKRRVIEPYNADVFVHTWDVTDHTTMTVSQNGESRTIVRPVDAEVKKDIDFYYSPKALEVEHQEPYDKGVVIETEKSRFSTVGPHYQFYTLRKANELRKQYERDNNIKYDCVLVTRPDVAFFSDFDICRVFEQAEKINLDIAKCRFFALSKQPAESNLALNINGTNDIIFFGKPAVIDKYIEVNKDIEVEYFKKHLINVVSVYTAKEIENGIMPIPVAYLLGEDWNFSGRMSIIRMESGSLFKKFVKKCIAVVVRPIFWFEIRHGWINSYRKD